MSFPATELCLVRLMIDQEALEAVKKLREKLEAEMKKLNYEGWPLKMLNH